MLIRKLEYTNYKAYRYMKENLFQALKSNCVKEVEIIANQTQL